MWKEDNCTHILKRERRYWGLYVVEGVYKAEGEISKINATKVGQSRRV